MSILLSLVHAIPAFCAVVVFIFAGAYAATRVIGFDASASEPARRHERESIRAYNNTREAIRVWEASVEAEWRRMYVRRPEGGGIPSTIPAPGPVRRQTSVPVPPPPVRVEREALIRDLEDEVRIAEVEAMYRAVTHGTEDARLLRRAIQSAVYGGNMWEV